MPGLPPAKAVTMAMQKDAYNPTIGLTPARMEKAIASGIKAIATVMPDKTSLRVLENQPLLYKLDCFKIVLPPVSVKGIRLFQKARVRCTANASYST
jgi:hypothetical protein